jgi:hypothetical protein
MLIGAIAVAQQQQQPPDPATLQRYLVEMQRARDERANEAVMARAEAARLTDEVAKMKAQVTELEKQLAAKEGNK